jgi:hypothetical protein
MRLIRLAPLLGVVVSVGVLVLVVLGRKSEEINNLVSGYDPAISGTILTMVGADGASVTSAIDKLTTNENPPRYLGRYQFGDGGVVAGCQYVGRAVVHNVSTADVYVISLQINGEAEEYVPVVYSGGDTVVVDRPGIRISLCNGAASSGHRIQTKVPRHR